MQLVRRGAALAASVVIALAALTACSGPTETPATTGAAVDQLIELGIEAADAGDLDKAESLFESALALDPGNTLANYDLGVIAQQRGDTSAATAYYDAALATSPEFTSAMYNKAIILEATDVEGAIGLYRQVIAIDPQAATSYLRLSLLLEAQGDTEGADAARASALGLDPSLESAIPTSSPDPVDETPAPTGSTDG